MDELKKIAKLEEMMDLEEGTLTAATLLDEIDEYDSMAKLSLIVLMSDEFDKQLTSEEIKGFKTVQDILDYMG